MFAYMDCPELKLSEENKTKPGAYLVVILKSSIAPLDIQISNAKRVVAMTYSWLMPNHGVSNRANRG